ncbi:MAG: cytochrome c [Comamonadaceae bacterium]|nr:MAG: cytochrome c [Comamonadaceae bacterium]
MRAVAASALSLAAATAPAQPGDTNRGKLLYETHCIRCHTEQMHWRAQRRATDPASLRAQVRRWQGEARLAWTDADIDAVARYLDDTIYRFPQDRQVGALQPLSN